MKDLSGKFAVVTGGGTGMGRELVRLLAAEGCNVALCAISEKNMAQTLALVEQDGPPAGVKVTAHKADVSDEAQLLRFRDEFQEQHRTDKLHLLFNNAGIGGGGSFVKDGREEWERTFSICWDGVYLGCRVFLPLMMKAEAGHIVNISSVNGFWASLSPSMTHTAYSAAKFAVKGFTEALVTDLRLNAPHLQANLVMPGHIGTAMVENYYKVTAGHDGGAMGADDVERARKRLAGAGIDTAKLSDDEIREQVAARQRWFTEAAPTTAAEAAQAILDGMKADRWRILVGPDAYRMDELVRADPEGAYEVPMFEQFKREVGWKLGG